MQKLSQIFQLLIFLIIFIPGKIFPQTKIQLLDSADKKTVPYANVWVKNGSWGTSSNWQGFFTLHETIKSSDSIVISVVGYENPVLKVTELKETLFLTPDIYEIPEITVISRERRKLSRIGNYKRSTINLWYAGGAKPQMLAGFFPYDSVSAKFPYLVGLEALFMSQIDNVKINVRLMKPDSAGFPGEYLVHQPLLVNIKKGKHTVYLDLSQQAVAFPPEGLFVAFEWIVIPENCYNMEYEDKISGEKKTVAFYQPEIGVVPKENNDYSFIYIGGFWRKIWQHKSKTLDKYDQKYAFPAVRLRLSN